MTSHEPSTRESTTGRSNSRYRPKAVTPLGWASRLSPALAGRLAVHWFTQPRRFRRPEREAQFLVGASPVELLPNVAAWAWGSGPTVLLVHGWEGRGSQLGSFVQPLVEAGYRVLTFDAPAHGDSGGRHSTLREFVRAIEAAERASGGLHGVIAHSFGCPAVSWALERGLRTNGVCFVAPPASLEMAPDFFGAVTGMTPEAVHAMKLCVARMVGISFEELRLENYGPRMRTPLYIVHDQDDVDVELANAQRYLEHWPGASLCVTRGLGHRRVLNDQSVLDNVVEFIDSVAKDDRESELSAWLGRQSTAGDGSLTEAATLFPELGTCGETAGTAPRYPTA